MYILLHPFTLVVLHVRILVLFNMQRGDHPVLQNLRLRKEGGVLLRVQTMLVMKMNQGMLSFSKQVMYCKLVILIQSNVKNMLMLYRLKIRHFIIANVNLLLLL